MPYNVTNGKGHVQEKEQGSALNDFNFYQHTWMSAFKLDICLARWKKNWSHIPVYDMLSNVSPVNLIKGYAGTPCVFNIHVVDNFKGYSRYMYLEVNWYLFRVCVLVDASLKVSIWQRVRDTTWQIILWHLSEFLYLCPIECPSAITTVLLEGISLAVYKYRSCHKLVHTYLVWVTNTINYISKSMIENNSVIYLHPCTAETLHNVYIM